MTFLIILAATIPLNIFVPKAVDKVIGMYAKNKQKKQEKIEAVANQQTTQQLEQTTETTENGYKILIPLFDYGTAEIIADKEYNITETEALESAILLQSNIKKLKGEFICLYLSCYSQLVWFC